MRRREYHVEGRFLLVRQIQPTFGVDIGFRWSAVAPFRRGCVGPLRVVLATAGATVTTAPSGIQALERISDLRPDVLVIDLGMPQMDGFEFITRLRKSGDQRVDSLPAAALSAFARPDARTQALQAGFETQLAKPVDPGELVASVATLVRRRAQRG
jgi:CheY-like chemotaxis protein